MKKTHYVILIAFVVVVGILLNLKSEYDKEDTFWRDTINQKMGLANSDLLKCQDFADSEYNVKYEDAYRCVDTMRGRPFKAVEIISQEKSDAKKDCVSTYEATLRSLETLR